MATLKARQDILKDYRVGKVTLLKWEKKGLKSYPVGKKIYYDVEEVEEFIKNRKDDIKEAE